MIWEAERFSRLIGDIYDAALDPSLWRGALRDIAGFVGGSASSICTTNARAAHVASHYHWGLQQSFVQNYFDNYVKYDPAAVGQFVFDVEDVYSFVDFLTFDELFESRFYKEFLKPEGWIDRIGATLDKSATSFAACVVFRNEQEGLVDENTRRRMRLVVPHIRRAVLVGNVVDLHNGEVSSLTALFDNLTDGVLLVDADARIVFTNTAARALLGEGDILRDHGGKLSAIDAVANRTLRDVFAATPNGDVGVGAEGVALPLSSASKEQWLVHTLPLTSGERRRTGTEYSATAAVFVRKAQLETPPLLKTVSTLYRLTPAEVRVLQAIVDVGGVPSVAEKLGVSQTTIRTHLKNLFAKTGMRRQADLVKLIASHSSPFNG